MPRRGALEWVPVTALLAAFLLCAGCGGEQKPQPFAAPNDRPVIVFSTFDDVLIVPVFDAYTAVTGATIVHDAGDETGIVDRLLDKRRSPAADLLIAGDAGVMARAVEEGVLRPVRSDLLDENVASGFREPDGYWYGLSVRLRPIVYNTTHTDPASLGGYMSLADEAFNKGLCLSSSSIAENRLLIARLIASSGEREAELAVRGWISNLATGPLPSDARLLDAIASGHCRVGIADAGLVAVTLRQRPDTPIAAWWLSPADGGTHAGVAGAGVTRHAQNPDGARGLIEWLVTEEGQAAFSGVRSDMTLEEVASSGRDIAPASTGNIAWRYEDAIRLADRAHYP